MLQRILIERATGNVVEENSALVIRSIGKGRNATKVLNFTLASNNFQREGQPQTTSYLRVSAFGRDAEILKQYLTKGKPLAVKGQLELRPYPSKKYHDDANNPATMISAEVRMAPNGFEFINGARRQSDEAAASTSEVAASSTVAEEAPAQTSGSKKGGKGSRSRKSAPVAQSGSTGATQDVGGPF